MSSGIQALRRSPPPAAPVVPSAAMSYSRRTCNGGTPDSVCVARAGHQHQLQRRVRRVETLSFKPLPGRIGAWQERMEW